MLLGLIHLLYTFYGPKLLPRDRDLRTRMEEVSPVITRETTMWKAWVGFNASHSYGAVLFGAVYGYLSLVHSAFLFQSSSSCRLGCCCLAGMPSWVNATGSAFHFAASFWQRPYMPARSSSTGPNKALKTDLRERALPGSLGRLSPPLAALEKGATLIPMAMGRPIT
jgi:hypothetical protein